MSNYSGFERYVAKFLSGFPFVKKIIKYGYSRFVYLFSCDKSKFKSKCHISFVGPSQKDTFFGYYDKSPENSAGLILCCVSDTATKVAPQIGFIRLSVYDKNNNELCSIETSAFNWQQGCRAMWVNSQEFIYNDFDHVNNSFVAKRFSLKTHSIVATYDFPIQDICRHEYFLSINYERLMTLRPDYGYRNKGNLTHDDLMSLDNDGIWFVNLKSNESRLIISLSDVVNYSCTRDYSKFYNKINHVMISPDGSKFIFIHRYIDKGRRHDRLLLASIEGCILKVLSDNDMVSHCNWLNNTTIISYLRGNDGVDGYYIINVTTNEYKLIDKHEYGSYGDGHPSVFQEKILTDTYPNKSRKQILYTIDPNNGSTNIIAELHHGFGYSGETRCDLHPRLSPCKKRVYFDTVCNGKRKLAFVTFPWIHLYDSSNCDVCLL